MPTLDTLTRDFLSMTPIAVAGVSRKGDTAANVIFKKMLNLGMDVHPINPHAEHIEGRECFRDLASVPGSVEALVHAAPPAAGPDLIKQCIENEVRHVWIHKGIGQGSYSRETEGLAREAGIKVIAGACPMMYLKPIDPFHRCARWFLRVSGKEAALAKGPGAPRE